MRIFESVSLLETFQFVEGAKVLCGDAWVLYIDYVFTGEQVPFGLLRLLALDVLLGCA